MAAWMIPAFMAAASALINKDTAERGNADKQRERERQARMSKWAGFNNAFIPTGVESDVNPWTAALQGGLVGGLTGAQLPEKVLGMFDGGSGGEIGQSGNSNPLGVDIPAEYLNKPAPYKAPSVMSNMGSLSQGFAKPQAATSNSILRNLLMPQRNSYE